MWDWSLVILPVFLLVAAFGIVWLQECQILWRKHKRENAWLEAGVPATDDMSSREFEQFLRAVFERNGYSVKLTSSSTDFGADLVAEKDVRRIAIEAKCYRQGRTVGNRAVRSVIGGREFHDCTNAMVVTNQFSEVCT